MDSSRHRVLLLLVFFILSFFVSACGGGGGEPSGGGAQVNEEAISVVIDPPSAAVMIGGSRTFTATVSGGPDAAITWSVREGDGGSITQDGRYTAPLTEGVFHVVAASQADPTKEATAEVTVTGGVPVPASIKISPEAATVHINESLPFSATVTGTPDTAVVWRLEEAAGSMTPAGVYTAPGIAGIYRLIATSLANPKVSAAATITVVVPPVQEPGISVSIRPAEATIRVTERFKLTAEVSGTPNSAVDWTIQQGPSGGTIGSDGLYTAPDKSGRYLIVAKSQADPTKMATATVTVLDGVTVIIDPAEATVAPNAAQSFRAQVLSSSNTEVIWGIQEENGGAITGSGLNVVYTAPNREGIFHLIATSVADNLKRAVAEVTVTAGVSVTINPKEAFLSAGGTQKFTASVAGSANTGVTWHVRESAGGTIASDGTYTAPGTAPSAATVFHVVAVSQADPSKSAKAAVTIEPASSGSRKIERVNVNSENAEANAESGKLYISGDGSVVTFESSATNLVPNDNAGERDMFLRDRRSGRTIRISNGINGSEADGDSFGSKMNWDGSEVVFESNAANLVPNDRNGSLDLFRYRRSTGGVERVSVDPAGQEHKTATSYAFVSANGQFLTFFSYANFTPEDTDDPAVRRIEDIYFRDLATGAMELITVGWNGGKGNAGSICPSVSDDGNFVAFQSDASNLVPNDTNSKTDIFVRDRRARTTRRVSVFTGGREGLDSAADAKISGNGKFVAITTRAALVDDDKNGLVDVYAHNLDTGETERVSIGSNGAEGNRNSWDARISADGRFVAFDSDAGNLVPGDVNGRTDVFVRDRLLGKTHRLSVSHDGKPESGDSHHVRISANGQFIAFRSEANNLVPGDRNRVPDIFVTAIPQ